MTKEAAHIIARALNEVFISPNVRDSNFEDANIVDVLDRIASALFRVAEALREGEIDKR